MSAVIEFKMNNIYVICKFNSSHSDSKSEIKSVVGTLIFAGPSIYISIQYPFMLCACC